MASTIRDTLPSLRECERDGDMLEATLLFSLTLLAYSATHLLLL